jgi:hypothetical protein
MAKNDRPKLHVGGYPAEDLPAAHPAAVQIAHEFAQSVAAGLRAGDPRIAHARLSRVIERAELLRTTLDAAAEGERVYDPSTARRSAPANHAGLWHELNVRLLVLRAVLDADPQSEVAREYADLLRLGLLHASMVTPERPAPEHR